MTRRKIRCAALALGTPSVFRRPRLVGWRAAAALLAATLGPGIAAGAGAVDIERVATPAGIEVWYSREARIPIVSVALAFRGGAALDPAGKEGLAAFAAGLFDEGAGALDSQAFQKAAADRAIEFRVQAGRDHLWVTMNTLSRHRAEAFRLLGLALSAPRFDEPAVERVRRLLLNARATDATNPRIVAADRWFRTVFPAHPYGRPTDGTAAGIAAITTDDLRTFVATRLARDNVAVAAAGDVSAAEIAALIDSALGGLPVSAAPADIGEAAFANAGRIVVAPLPSPQSAVVFGLPGPKRDDPDFYAAVVMNEVLGGGSASRLFAEVREKRGLAYDVHAYLYPLAHAGLYMGGAATRNDRVAETIAVVRATLARLAAEGVSARELAAAKGHLTGAFPLRFDSGRKIARTMLHVRLQGLGIDYFDRRNGHIEAVTREDVARVARRLLRPDLLTLVVAGAPEGIEGAPRPRVAAP